MAFPKLSDGFIVNRLAYPDAGPLPVILDTDTANEVDDQFALTWAVLSPDRIDLQAVHTAPFHNERSASPEDGQLKSVAEARRVLEAMGRATPVVQGCVRYLPSKSEPVDSPAARDLVSRGMARSPEDAPLYVATIGCLTNVASALLMEPELVRRLVVVMLAGNDIEWPYAGEFNLSQDIPAVQVVLESGVPLVQISAVRMSWQLGLSPAEVEAHVRGCGRIGDLLAELYRQQCDLTPGARRPIWDLAAIAYLIDHGLAPTSLRPKPTLTVDGFWSPNLYGQPIRQVVFMNPSGIYMDFFRKLAALRRA